MVIVIETEDFFKSKMIGWRAKGYEMKVLIHQEIENSQRLLYFLRSLNLRQW